MLDLGFSEMMLIAAVALVVLGPERLPKVARTVGHLVGRMQRYVGDVKADITREMELDELRKFRQTVEETVEETASSVQSGFNALESSAREMSDDLETLAREQARVDAPLPAPSLDAPLADGDAAGAAAIGLPPAPGHELTAAAMPAPEVRQWHEPTVASAMSTPAEPATYGATTALAMSSTAAPLTGGCRWPGQFEPPQSVASER